jgi:AcrR family transcriptional regulator
MPFTRLVRRRRAGSALERRRDALRLQILSAMVQVASENPVDCVTVEQIVGRAGVSRATFYKIFDDRSDCLNGVVEEAVLVVSERMSRAYSAEKRWIDRIRAGLLALLKFIDEERELARLCVARAAAGDSVILTRRTELLAEIARVIDLGREAAGAEREPPPLAAEDAIGGVAGMIHARLISTNPRPVVELLNPLMGMLVLPYLGGAAALTEVSRPMPGGAGRQNPLRELDMRMTYRTRRVLATIEAQPGLSNVEISRLSGVSDQGQISRHLARLARLRLVENLGEGQPKGSSNAWRLTPRGEAVERAMREMPAPRRPRG